MCNVLPHIYSTPIERVYVKQHPPGTNINGTCPRWIRGARRVPWAQQRHDWQRLDVRVQKSI